MALPCPYQCTIRLPGGCVRVEVMRKDGAWQCVLFDGDGRVYAELEYGADTPREAREAMRTKITRVYWRKPTQLEL